MVRAPSPASLHNSLALKLMPSLCLVLISFMSLSALPLPLVNIATPHLLLMALYFFTLWQPRYVPFIVVFLCGLIYDSMHSTLFGTHTLLLLCFRLSISALRNKTGFIEQNIANWGYYVACASCYLVIEWFVIGVQTGATLPTGIIIERNILTLLLYPLLHLALSSIIASIQSRT